MGTNVIMPQLGLTMTGGTVARWFKTVGDAIKAGEVLVEVTTDKINHQVEAPVDGVVLQIAVPEGVTVPVKTVLAVIGEAGEDVSSVTGAAEKATVASVDRATTATETTVISVMPDHSLIKASPAAKKMAREKNVDLARVSATGPDGRIVERDVARFVEEKSVKTTPVAARMAAEYGVDLTSLVRKERIAKADVLTYIAPSETTPTPVAPVACHTVPLAGIRKVIAERMSASWRVPHVTYHISVDMGSARTLREKLQEMLEKKYCVRLSYTDFIVKACAAALRDMPDLNVSLADNDIVYHNEINIGVAVAIDKGLIVPVVTSADIRTLGETAKIIRDLTMRAREGKLITDEISGGTFTITNLGMYGIDNFTPVINPPESAILGVGRIVDTPVVKDGTITVAQMMQLSLSADHRTIDGALAAKFLQKVKQYLEEPLLLIC